MKRFSRSRRDTGFAYIITLALFLILLSMLTVALRVNATRRTELRVQRDVDRAFALAESGAAEALNALSSEQRAGVVEGRIGHGQFTANWAPVDSSAGVFEIVSTGTMPTRLRAMMRKTVRLRVQVIPPAEGGPAGVTTLKWKM